VRGSAALLGSSGSPPPRAFRTSSPTSTWTRHPLP
jgi:hypothetical protein